MVELLAFGGGLVAWTVVEYAVHGLLAHILATFISPLHDVHHRDPAAVFAIGAWPPVFIIWIACLLRFSLGPGTIALTGLLAGFMAYEIAHYRMHFSRPASRVESYLRTRHLFHHLGNPDLCYGVTTPLWDFVFGTNADAASIHEILISDPLPLSGPSNLGTLTSRISRAFARRRARA